MSSALTRLRTALVARASELARQAVGLLAPRPHAALRRRTGAAGLARLGVAVTICFVEAGRVGPDVRVRARGASCDRFRGF